MRGQMKKNKEIESTQGDGSNITFKLGKILQDMRIILIIIIRKTMCFCHTYEQESQKDTCKRMLTKGLLN